MVVSGIPPHAPHRALTWFSIASKGPQCSDAAQPSQLMSNSVYMPHSHRLTPPTRPPTRRFLHLAASIRTSPHPDAAPRPNARNGASPCPTRIPWDLTGPNARQTGLPQPTRTTRVNVLSGPFAVPSPSQRQRSERLRSCSSCLRPCPFSYGDEFPSSLV